MNAAGWYPNPVSGPIQRFWDGRQWTTATAVLAVTPVLVVDQAVPQPFIARHRWLTSLSVLWVVVLVLHWWWLAPLLIAGFGLQRATRLARHRADTRARENARTSAEADYENRLVLQGDMRGTYGKYWPAGNISDAR